MIDDYVNKLHLLFEKLIEFNRDKNQNGLIPKIKHMEKYQEEEIISEFQKVWKMTQRRLKNDPDMSHFIKEVEDNISLLESDFINYIEKSRH